MSEDRKLEQIFSDLAACENSMEKVEREVEQFKATKTKDVYLKRQELTKQIPKYWFIVLSEHDDFSEYIQTDDLRFLENITDIYVDWDLENSRDFSITIAFDDSDNKITAQVVTKHFKSEIDEETNQEKLVSEPATIQWPKEYDSINPYKITDKKSAEGKKNYRKGMKTFFAWFSWTGKKAGKEFRSGEELTRALVEDIFPYSTKYYTQACLTGQIEGDSSSEELDVSDEEVDEKDEEEEEEEEEEHRTKKPRIN
ncbi:Vacuolar protein sorting-associated protein 75 [Komagataella phaffii CBS 7435]|uniref:NAP family histone chaperone n=2 Tax=Komagataella phaffii TaxID=460519 RepID=C4R563_KOMPG|nr:NAP family histone chaperone [Komagataella phaffii GS115]CAH2449525.1 Vacuolar protein sorting-associated protein 75 [Komagataella phaffii CBS 7435]CAY70699.1 NAP family histone chaperone [Komagataella phaffii GS115]CCA39507.1 Vacuolar protein sorting-associated protein 75 [Komagataella phaffii CBS 7435]